MHICHSPVETPKRQEQCGLYMGNSFLFKLDSIHLVSYVFNCCQVYFSINPLLIGEFSIIFIICHIRHFLIHQYLFIPPCCKFSLYLPALSWSFLLFGAFATLCIHADRTDRKTLNVSITSTCGQSHDLMTVVRMQTGIDQRIFR